MFILEDNSFGSQLGKSINAGLQRGSEFAQQMALKNNKQTKNFADFFKNQKQAEGGVQSGFSLANMDPMQKATFAEQFPKAYKVLQAEEEKAQDIKGTTDTLDWIDENSKYSGKFGLPPKWGGVEAEGEAGGLALKDAEGRQLSNAEIQGIREGIDSSGIWAADKVYTHFNKGVLNKVKWEDVKLLFAPNSKLPSYINKARTASLRRIMGLAPNSSPEAVKAVIEKEKKALEKIEKAKGVSGEMQTKERPPLESFFE